MNRYNHQCPPPRRHSTQGFTLIEIMVALTVGLFLIGGVMQLFMSNRLSYTMQTQLGLQQENARFALDLISTELGQAGYTTLGTFDKFDSTTPNPPIENDQENATLGLTQANNQASDTITFQHRYVDPSDNTIRDCLNADVTAAGMARNTFYLDDPDGDGTYSLMCLGNGNASAAPLVDGIDNMQILYGEDLETGMAADRIANSYVSADNVTDWNSVVAVRIAILVSTLDSAGGSDSGTHSLLNTPMMGPFNDDQTRRVYTRTIILRNSGG